MKSNIIKYIFIAFAIFIIGFAIYKINYENKDEEQQVENTVETKQVTESILNIGISDFDNINPLITDNQDIIRLSTILYEPLLEITQDYGIENRLASEWSKLDATTYLVKLKDNLKWEDGTALTGSDVKFTIEKLKEGKSAYSDNVKNIKSVEIIDGNTLRLELKEEEPFFEYNLIFPIVSSNQFKDEKNFYKSRLAPIATGMYKVTAATKDSMELSKNENWFDANNTELKIDKISLTFYDTMGDVYNSLKIGNIDFICTSKTNVKDYIGTIGFNTTKYKGRDLDFISFNCSEGPLADKEVRKAINYAIDKKKINSSVFSNNNYVSSFPLDYGSYLYNKEGSSDYNKEKAKETLENAGWEYRYGYWRKTENYNTEYLNIDLVVDSSNSSRVKVAEEIEKQLEDIGINVYVYRVSNSSYKQYLENKNYEMIITGISNGYSPDLTYFFGDDNIANYNNEEMKNILNEVKNISDQNTLKEKYNRIVEIYEDEMPYVCLYRNIDKVVYSIRVTGNIVPNIYTVYNNFETWYRQ
jgi:peptide/nickel transport system substrate-binding protein